jgi:hypothetical protein
MDNNKMNASSNGFAIRLTALGIIITSSILQFGCLAPYAATTTTTTTTNPHTVLASSHNDKNAFPNFFGNSNDKDNNKSTYDASISRFITEDEKKFQQLEFIEYLGNGQTITAIKCQYKAKTYVAKLAGDDDIGGSILKLICCVC